MAKLVVLIDAGHGLYTAGKRTPDDSLREFHFNSATAEKLGKELTNYENVEVHFVYDRDGSEDTPLINRTNTANKIYAQYKGKKDVNVVYISIHANAYGSGWNSANGIETYAYISKPAEAVKLATNVQNELIKATGLANRGVKYADFHVLRETAMTAILCECGFMTNKNEAELLKSDGYRTKVANAIIEALAKQYGIKRKPAPTPALKPVTEASNDGLFYRVVAGSYNNRANAEEQIVKLKKAGFDAFLLPYHK